MKNHGKKVMSVNVLLDVGVIALIFLFGYSGFKRGIVYMAISTAGTILSAVAAALLSSAFAPMIYNSFIRDNIISEASSATSGISRSDPALAAEQTLDSVSNFTRNTLSHLGVDQESLTEKLSETDLEISDTVEAMLRPAAIQVVACVLMIVLFLILAVVTAFLARKFSKNINRTVLGIPNKIAGAAVGIVEAALIIMILDMILFFVMMFISQSSYEDISQSINKTVLYKPIMDINIPGKIIEGLSSL